MNNFLTILLGVAIRWQFYSYSETHKVTTKDLFDLQCILLLSSFVAFIADK